MVIFIISKNILCILLFSELGEVKSSIDDSQITSKISKIFNRLDSSIEKTEKKISSFEENLSKKLEDAIDFTSSVSAADLCAIIANELDKKVIQVRKNKKKCAATSSRGLFAYPLILFKLQKFS